MVITTIKGGLGNQMFQYACGRSVALKLNEPLKLDLHFFEENTLRTVDTARQFKLDKFNIEATIASKSEIKALSLGMVANLIKRVLRKISSKKSDFEPNINVLIENKQRYLDGFWQSETYFAEIRDLLVKELSLKNPLSQDGLNVQNKIMSAENPISLHIRRGDYVKVKTVSEILGTQPLKYYSEAADLIASKATNPTFFIFSDDIAWVKENLNLKHPVFYVSDLPQISDHEELYLMTLCKHNIISNSSFSWWGAWLNQNPNKIVIAPKKWFNDETWNKDDLVPESWTKI